MIDRVPLALAVVLVGAMWLLGSSAAVRPEEFATLEAFVAAFSAAIERQQLFVFPIAVTTSIATILALLSHMNLRSGRGRFQVLAVVALFGSGILWSAVGEPTAQAIVSQAQTGAADGLARLLERWTIFRWISFGIALTATASLAAAQRMPLVFAAHGTLASITPEHRTLLFLLGAATLFEGYDRFIVSLALPYIGDDLGAGSGVLGFALSAIRIGALLSIVLGRMADRHGRRKLLLFTVLAYTIATAATGLSRGIVEFVAFQLLATIFLVTELSLAQVVITEEFPASVRARGQGFLGAFGALGAGMAALLFPVFQKTALGWRGLYFFGILPLLLIAWLRRAMPETRRWQNAHRAGETERFRLRDLVGADVRLQFLVLVGIAAAMTLAAGPAFAFASYRATKVFAWSPSQVSGMILIGGGIGFFGWFVFGGLAESIGRRVVGVIATAGAGLAAIAFYQTSMLFVSFAALVFMEAGAQIAVNALGTELFPTRMRSTAKAWITYSAIIGAMIGLAIVGGLAEPLGSADAVVTLLACLPVATSAILLVLPETRGRELEEIERRSPPAAVEA